MYFRATAFDILHDGPRFRLIAQGLPSAKDVQHHTDGNSKLIQPMFIGNRGVLVLWKADDLKQQDIPVSVILINTMRASHWIAVGILAGSALLCVTGGVILAEGALRPPRRPVASISPNSSIQTREIRAQDGARLRAWIVFPAAPSGNCVMVLHGIGDTRQSSLGFAPLFIAQHYTVLMPDSRAHGDSEGDITTYGVREADDVRRWVDRLITSEACQRVYGLGESLGGGILLQSLATERRFRAVVAECAFASLERIGEDRVGQLLRLPPTLGRVVAVPLVRCASLYCQLRYKMDASAASPEDAVTRTLTPILLIHGLNDRKTSPEHSRILASRNPQIVLWLVPGAAHTNAWAAAPDEFPRRVLGWFASHQ
jgi:uncharacterized protein